jgi:flagellar basal-body rod protein FlgG
MEAAASGMAAQQLNLEIITENLANADVAGFKSATARFVDAGGGPNRGRGTAPAGRQAVLAQGKLMKSGGPFDVAIEGPGFFRVERGGQAGYTRNGQFSRAADGSLRTTDGWRLRDVALPPDALRVAVGRDGRVHVDLPERAGVELGRIRLAGFAVPESLRALDATVFAATAAAGPEQRIDPSASGGTGLAFGMLERSNVSIVEAMMQILTAQRAYEANAKGVQAADEMQRIANNLHRG